MSDTKPSSVFYDTQPSKRQTLDTLTKLFAAPFAKRIFNLVGTFSLTPIEPIRKPTRKRKVNLSDLDNEVKRYINRLLRKEGVKKNTTEYHTMLFYIMQGALIDANFHTSAKKLHKYFPKIHKISRKEELYFRGLGDVIAEWTRWDGIEIVNLFSTYSKIKFTGLIVM